MWALSVGSAVSGARTVSCLLTQSARTVARYRRSLVGACPASSAPSGVGAAKGAQVEVELAFSVLAEVDELGRPRRQLGGEFGEVLLLLRAHLVVGVERRQRLGDPLRTHCLHLVSSCLIVWFCLDLPPPRVVLHLPRCLLDADRALERDYRMQDPGRRPRLSRVPYESPQDWYQTEK